jgi:hypothetical protein
VIVVVIVSVIAPVIVDVHLNENATVDVSDTHVDAACSLTSGADRCHNPC